MRTVITCIIICVCVIACGKSNSRKQVYPNPKLQTLIDSLVDNNKLKNQSYIELFVDKTVDFRGDIILHIGSSPYYDESILSPCYMLSNNKEISLYSGIESYFSSAKDSVEYVGSNKGIDANENHSLWIIRMYKDSIVDVYETYYANPFLLITSSPKTFINPFDIDNE